MESFVFEQKALYGHFQKKMAPKCDIEGENQLNYMPLTFMLCCYIHISVS